MTARDLAAIVASAAVPLPAIDDEGFGAMFDALADARLVLLGEASHGTAEFYRARAAITRHLIERHGFSIVAVEADWPDAATIDAYVRERPAPPIDGPAFSRFPTWMWRNTDVAAFIGWLRQWNAGRPADGQAGFHGLDLYNMAGAISAVLAYLDRTDSQAAREARDRYGCIMPWADQPEAYGHLAASAGFAVCEQPVVEMLCALHARQMACLEDCEALRDATANARLIANAEAYYRAAYWGSTESWNLRDTHMFETLCALLDAKGPDAKAVVWAHNSHIGDVSRTEKGWTRGQLSLGQLCRERFGTDAALVGFGTHGGTVACASDWDEPMEVKQLLPSRLHSYERIMHDSGIDRFLLDLRSGFHDEARIGLHEPRLQRFVGVIYRPETERWSHYYSCRLPEQFDFYLWFDQTQAVMPLPARPRPGADDLWPTGL